MNELYEAEAAEAALAVDAEQILRMLKDIYAKRFDVRTEIDMEMFEAVWAELEKAIAEGYGKPSVRQTERFDFYQALRRSTAVFSAFKVHRMQNDMAAQMLDADGRLKPFRQWARDVAPIADHQVGNWLRTEYATAVKRAHLAADWQQFEAEADVFPNLEWLPSTSIERRLEHAVFYGLVLPIHHPFWRENFPGNLWGCKCGIQATDAVRTPEADIPASWKTERPDKGLDENPALTGEVFSRSHPYYTQALDGAQTAVQALMDRIYPDYAEVRVEPQHIADYRVRRKELRQLAKSLIGEAFHNEDFGRDVTINMRRIKEYLNQPHKHYAHKNELLLNMSEVMPKAKYMGHTVDGKRRANVLRSHVFEIRLLGDKSWIIVHETTEGEILLHSISDSPRVLEGIKK